MSFSHRHWKGDTMDIKEFRYDGKRKFKIKDFNTDQTGEFENKSEVEARRGKHIQRISELQDKLYAENKEGLLIIIQAMDAAGKDGAIKHVLSGINPAGISIRNFKVPSVEESNHDYMWRAMRYAPERGTIMIFNRSYYEEVLVVKVHNLHLKSQLPDRCKTDMIFEDRYQQIKGYENYLYENGIRVVKLFLNISKDEQKKQFLQRIDDPSKNWKFSDGDMVERESWDQYMEAFQDMVNNTSTTDCPWYVIPCDKKWFAREVISEIIIQTLEAINPQYPKVDEARKAKLAEFRRKLMEEPESKKE